MTTEKKKAPGLSRRWFCSLHCSGRPIWEWWRLLLFSGPYQSHGGRSTPSPQMDLQPPWVAMGGGRCAIRGTTWEKIGEGWGQGYLGSVFITLMSHVLQSDRQANWKLLSHKILHGSLLPRAPSPRSQKKNKKRKIICSIDGFLWVNNSFSPVLVIPTQNHNVRLGGIKGLGQKNK